MKKRLLSTIVFFLILSVFTIPVAAQDPIRPDPLPPIEPPIWNFSGLTIEYQRVDVQIKDQVSITHIDQLFVNNNDWMLEGTYLFPLPPEAAVSELTMWVDGKPIEAKILESDEARDIYDQIVRQLRDPALLEYVGTSAIQANVFPIPPNDERRIEIEYTQLLPAENGLVKYQYPQSTDLYTNTPLDNQSIRVEISSDEEIRTIYSPSHPVAIDRDGDYRAVAGYEDSNVFPDKDFELYYTISPDEIGLNLVSFKEPDQDGFFLLLVAPAVKTDASEVVAKDVILVLDTSGSMAGGKLRQAQDAVSYVVRNLNNQDRFNIITFSTGVSSYARDLLPASEPGNFQSYIDRLEAMGGTNISSALLEAVGQSDQERPTTILFMTDGLATEGITDTGLILDTIRNQTPENVRVFAFGVGDDVDTYLLDSLAQEHSGSTTYVRPGQQIDEAVSGFYAKVSTPILANIEIDFDNIIVDQMYPQEVSDLFAGTQLVLTGRYREGGAATITLSGDVNNRHQAFVYEDNFFRNNGGEDFIPRLWATRAVGNLLTQIRLHGEDPELVESVIGLSIRYGIITPYTSYLIEEDDIFTQSGRDMIIEEEVRAPEAMEVSGAIAVDKAVEESELAYAEAPMAMPEETVIYEGTARSINEVVQNVGSKTFVLRDGLWIDTTYDADQQAAQQIDFASEPYFELLETVPSLGKYLALGSRVLVVYDGDAYEIVESGGDSSIVMPEPQPDDPFRTEEPIDGPTPAPVDVAPSLTETPIEQADDSQSGFCSSLLVAPLLLFGLAVVFGRRNYLGTR